MATEYPGMAMTENSSVVTSPVSNCKYDDDDRFHQIFVVDDGKLANEFTIKHGVLSFLYKTFSQISSISIDVQQKKIRITIIKPDQIFPEMMSDSIESTILNALDGYVLRTQGRKDVFVKDLFFIYQSVDDFDATYELCENKMDD